MATPEANDLIVAGGAAATGGGLMYWAAKSLFQRMVTQNDALHAKHESLYNSLSSTIGDFKVKLAVLEVALSELKGLKTDVNELRERIAVADRKLEKAWEAIEAIKRG
jgi:hypothetical protein